MPTILRRPDVGYAMRLKTSTRLKPWLGGPILRRAMPASFKAVLVFLRIDFPRVHDLDTLRALVPQDWPFRDEHLRLGGLTEWAIEARYPGTWTDATAADAEKAVRQARAVWDSIERDLMAHGLEVEPAEAPAPDGEQ